MTTKQLTYLFSIPYFILVIFVIAVKLLNLPELENIFKPLLLLVLMVWFAFDQKANGININRVFMAALFFSLIGDVFLMPLFDDFILGLVFFLFSHVFYILVFMKGNWKVLLPSLKQGKLFLIGVLSVYSGLLVVLMPTIYELDSMLLLIAVPVYATVLMFMVLSAFVYSKVHYYQFGRFVMRGGLLFLVSDSIIAINEFSFDVPYSPIWIMGIYTLSQWMLVYGYMNSKKKALTF